MKRLGPTALGCLGGLVLLSLTSALASPVAEIVGLEAWYTGHSLHQRMHGGEPVKVWKDSSGNGHHLTDDENGIEAVFHKLQVGGKPAVHLGESNSHSVTNPFSLDDHTIFLVYQATCKRCALLQGASEGEDGTGIVLREQGLYDYYRRGGARVAANSGLSLEGEFGITVLGRKNGELRSFVNGEDLSSGAVFGEAIEVGRFFTISHSRASKGDGFGLRIAEMIFYDRYLDDEDRNSVMRYLEERYEVGPATNGPLDPPSAETAEVSLGSGSSANLNGEQPVFIEWNISGKTAAPFEHDAKNDGSRLYCTKNGTRARLLVSLPMTTSKAGTNVRVLVLKNDEEYLEEEGSSGPMTVEGPPVIVRILTRVRLDAGDYLQVVTEAQGVPGKVTLKPEQALLSVETD